MNLRHLTDETLEKDIAQLVRNERMTLVRLLHHLLEHDRRKLFSKLKYKSMYDYLMQVHGYSRDEAYRRTLALKFLKQFPEKENAIASGKLSLTHLGLLKEILNSDLPRAKKLEIIEQAESKSTRELEKMMKPEKSFDDLKIQASPALLQKIEKLKGLLAHSNPNLSTSELFEMLCDLGIEKWDPAEQKIAAPRINSKAEIKRQVWQRAESQCENCGSVHALETDHIWGQAMGGESTLENMRLLCRNCNQRAGIELYGMEKMNSYQMSLRQI